MIKELLSYFYLDISHGIIKLRDFVLLFFCDEAIDKVLWPYIYLNTKVVLLQI